MLVLGTASRTLNGELVRSQATHDDMGALCLSVSWFLTSSTQLALVRLCKKTGEFLILNLHEIP